MFISIHIEQEKNPTSLQSSTLVVPNCLRKSEISACQISYWKCVSFSHLSGMNEFVLKGSVHIIVQSENQGLSIADSLEGTH